MRSLARAIAIRKHKVWASIHANAYYCMCIYVISLGYRAYALKERICANVISTIAMWMARVCFVRCNGLDVFRDKTDICYNKAV